MVMLPNPPPMPRLQATSLALRCGVELVCQMWSGQSWRCNSQRIYWCRFKTQKNQQWCVCTVYQQQQWVFAGEDGWNKRCITINNQVYLAIRKKIFLGSWRQSRWLNKSTRQIQKLATETQWKNSKLFLPTDPSYPRYGQPCLWKHMVPWWCW